MISFGPSGIGGRDEAEKILEFYKQKGIRTAEVAFTYSVYLKEGDALRIGKKAKELGIRLSIHAPYYINLNSDKKSTLEASKKRILDCCKIGSILGVRKVVFHAGYYGKEKEKAYENIKKAVLEMQKEIKRHEWNVELAPELMGRKNVFGSIEEISKLVKETHCSFCIDFAHVLARYGDYNLKELEKAFPQKEWQCHFSGIVYNDKGERAHKKTPESEWKKLLGQIPKSKELVIINESPSPVEDAVEGMRIYGKM